MMKTFLSNLFFNLLRKREYFLANTILLGLIALFLYTQDSPALTRTMFGLLFNLALYLILTAQSKKYVLRKQP